MSTLFPKPLSTLDTSVIKIFSVCLVENISLLFKFLLLSLRLIPHSSPSTIYISNVLFFSSFVTCLSRPFANFLNWAAHIFPIDL